MKEEEVKNDYYEMTPEQEAVVKRADNVWEAFRKRWDLDKLTVFQRNGVRNMLFRMQDAEHKHFGIEIPKGRVVEAANPSLLGEKGE